MFPALLLIATPLQKSAPTDGPGTVPVCCATRAARRWGRRIGPRRGIGGLLRPCTTARASSTRGDEGCTEPVTGRVRLGWIPVTYELKRNKHFHRRSHRGKLESLAWFQSPWLPAVLRLAETCRGSNGGAIKTRAEKGRNGLPYRANCTLSHSILIGSTIVHRPRTSSGPPNFQNNLHRSPSSTPTY